MTRQRATRREFLQACAAATLLPGAPLRAWAAPDPSRVALVIGNDAYPGAPLANAVHDAKSMGTLLADAGFTVDLKTNVDRAGMADAAKAFVAAAERGEARFVFFYCAGHGAQLDWRNYLLPVDAASTPRSTCRHNASTSRRWCASSRKRAARRSSLCSTPAATIRSAARSRRRRRDFRNSTRRPAACSRSRLRRAASPPTAPGRAASTRRTRCASWAMRGARIEDAFKRVRLAVRMASRGAQVPWESTSLESDVYLYPTPARKLSEKALEEEVLRELVAWNKVKGSQQYEDWFACLREFPSGRLREIAQSRLTFFLRVEAERMVLATRPATVAVATPAPVPSAVASAPTATGPAIAVRAQLEVRSGAPAPVLMRPSENPNPTGTYAIGHRYSVGDEAVYAISPIVGGDKLPNLEWRVTRVDEVADVVEINGGMYVLDTMGNLVKWLDRVYGPRFQMEPAELAVGKRWTTLSRFTIGGRQLGAEYEHTVVAREKVTVPAGTFEAFALEGTGISFVGGSTFSLRSWVVPGVNFALKVEYVARMRGIVAPSGELRELVSCRQLRWTQA